MNIIGIHNSNTAYSKRWIEYCKINGIKYRIVDAYSNSIIEDLQGCTVFLWHHHHGSYKDVNFAKQLLFSLEQSGMKVFPDFKTGWHFDDKLGQKYLFEAHSIPSAKAWVFYDKKSAYEWLEETDYPKVFKLRGGAGSANVRLIRSKSDARKVVKKAFSSGFGAFDYFGLAKDKFGLFLKGKASIRAVVRYTLMWLFPSRYEQHLLPRHKGYIYFQEFIPNDGYDIRIEITGDKALALTRRTREGDFRASGSNNVIYDTDLLNSEVITFAFDVADKLGLQSCALDIVRDKRDGKLYIIENSYCYGVDDDEFDHGFWTREGVYFKDAKFNGIDWIMDEILEK